eukprot:jgi/Chlat1/1830/Chrsp14S02224
MKLPAFLAGPEKKLNDFFQIRRRKSSWLTELRAGFTLFMTSAYILFLNPLILSAAGMPKDDILLATAISTGFATLIMAIAGNYPWVCSVQLGTNVYFVYNVVKPHPCADDPTQTCYETPYPQALAAVFLEGLVFTAIACVGMRSVLLKLFPTTVLMAGACGIGVFIAWVGVKQNGFIIQNSPPTLTKLNPDFNICALDANGAPRCPWLAMAGLFLTGLLMLYRVNAAMLIGILFTTFITWIRWHTTAPDSVVRTPKFHETAGNLDFHWGDNTKTLVEAFITFLYLDFIGSCITFYSMGEIPRCNWAFLSDGLGTTLGGVLGTSSITTYVESAAAVRDGGRTGITALVCALLFFLCVFFSPIFAGPIPDIATGPILMLIGVVIFLESVIEINWMDLTEAIPAFLTIITMPFTNNIAYGAIMGLASYFCCKFVTFRINFWKFRMSEWPIGKRVDAYIKRMEARSSKLDLGDDQPALPMTVNDQGKVVGEDGVEMPAVHLEMKPNTHNVVPSPA